MSDNINLSYQVESKKETPTIAIISLVASASSFLFVPVIGAIVGLITGYMAKKRILESDGRLGGMKLVKWSIPLGYLHLFLFTLIIIFAVLALLGVFTFFGGISFCGICGFLEFMSY